MEEFERQKMDLLCDSKIVSLYRDYLKKPDGNIVEYDYVKHKSGGGAGVLLVDANEYTYLIRQYRNTISGICIEIPAGGYSYPGEPGETCAIREAEEETGYIPGKVYHVANMISSVGAYDEKTDVYIGTDLREGKVNLDEDECIDVVHMPVCDAINMIYDGKIIDSKTIVALLAYRDMKEKGIIL